jgi:hypothetical protein
MYKSTKYRTIDECKDYILLCKRFYNCDLELALDMAIEDLMRNGRVSDRQFDVELRRFVKAYEELKST